MCLQMAPLHAVNSGTLLAIGSLGGTALTAIGVYTYKARDRIKNIFRMK